MRNLSEKLLVKSQELRKEILSSLDLVYETKAEMLKKQKFVFRPSIKVDDLEVILSYDGQFAKIESDLIHKSDLTNSELIKIISSLENNFYDK